MDAEDSVSTTLTKKKTMRSAVDSSLKMSGKHSIRNSSSNWMLRVISEQIENNIQEITASLFELTVSIGKFHKGLDKPLQKSILEDEHNRRIFCILQEITQISAWKRNKMISQELPNDIKKEKRYVIINHRKITVWKQEILGNNRAVSVDQT